VRELLARVATCARVQVGGARLSLGGCKEKKLDFSPSLGSKMAPF